MTLRASACVNSPARRTASTFCQGDRGLTSYRRLRLLLRLFDAVVSGDRVGLIVSVGSFRRKTRRAEAAKYIGYALGGFMHGSTGQDQFQPIVGIVPAYTA